MRVEGNEGGTEKWERERDGDEETDRENREKKDLNIVPMQQDIILGMFMFMCL